jgi:hypothetical protein
MTRRGFLGFVSAVAGLMAHPDRGSMVCAAASHDLPRPSGFVDHDGWIVTAADRDALVGIEGPPVTAPCEGVRCAGRVEAAAAASRFAPEQTPGGTDR